MPKRWPWVASLLFLSLVLPSSAWARTYVGETVAVPDSPWVVTMLEAGRYHGAWVNGASAANPPVVGVESNVGASDVVFFNGVPKKILFRKCAAWEASESRVDSDYNANKTTYFRESGLLLDYPSLLTSGTVGYYAQYFYKARNGAGPYSPTSLPNVSLSGPCAKAFSLNGELYPGTAFITKGVSAGFGMPTFSDAVLDPHMYAGMMRVTWLMHLRPDNTSWDVTQTVQVVNQDGFRQVKMETQSVESVAGTACPAVSMNIGGGVGFGGAVTTGYQSGTGKYDLETALPLTQNTSFVEAVAAFYAVGPSADALASDPTAVVGGSNPLLFVNNDAFSRDATGSGVPPSSGIPEVDGGLSGWAKTALDGFFRNFSNMGQSVGGWLEPLKWLSGWS